jgi:DNA-3-methyladenine glycosylase II
LPGPIDFAASLELFRRSGDDLIDRWDGTYFIRTAPIGKRRAAFLCQMAGTVARPVVHVMVANPQHRQAVEQALRTMVVARPPEFRKLLQNDPVIARLHAQYPGLRLIRQIDLLTALVRCISAQQVNLRWAATTRRRLAEAFGNKHRIGKHVVYSLNAERLAALSVSELRALQFTTSKAEFLIGVAKAIASGRLNVARLSTMSDEEVIDELTLLRGIGVWSAEWILARTLGRPRVVAGDLGVRKAVGLAYRIGKLPVEKEVRQATAHWGPSAGMAQALLLHALGEGQLK